MAHELKSHFLRLIKEKEGISEIMSHFIRILLIMRVTLKVSKETSRDLENLTGPEGTLQNLKGP